MPPPAASPLAVHDGRSASDAPEATALKSSLLILATVLMGAASALWWLLYWLLGVHLSAVLPLLFSLLLGGNLALYLCQGNFRRFRTLQLGLFLLAPFAIQWSMGSFISASGVSLWGLLAPVGAILFIGPRAALPWFGAYLLLAGLSGGMDVYRANMTPPGTIMPATTSALFFALNVTTVSTLVFLLLRYATVEKERTQNRLEEAHRLLQAEQQRSERLLLNVLPAAIAKRLKDSDRTIADGFADVTVMFVDIVNFTQVAEGLSPQQVFSMLNRIFSTFDELAEHYGLEKIKTIGDAYMVAGGLNSGSAGEDGGVRIDYTEAMANLALAMRNLLLENCDINRRRLDVRIGIGTGPVVGGVVGKKKFIYDLWGDTVNTASRITSEGAPGMIQVDAVTYQRLRDRFDFLAPVTLNLKGKGDMEVHRLNGRRTTTTAATPSQ